MKTERFFTKRNLIYFLVMSFIFISCEQNSNTENDSGTSGSLESRIFNPKDDLVGDFATKLNGKANLRITKENGNYYLQNWNNGLWTRPKQLENATDSYLNKLFGSEWKNFIVTGLQDGVFGIFKVKIGYTTSKGHTFKTGYYLLFFGEADIYKLN